MKLAAKLAAAVAVAGLGSSAFGAIFTVDATGILNPNPNNLVTTEVGNTSLSVARDLVKAAKIAGTGGVLDFQQVNQGGTFPNGAVANGVDLGNGAANPLYVTNASGPGTTGAGLVGTPFFSFYRLEADTNSNGAIAFDSNLNQGGGVISGGFSSRYPGTQSLTNPLGDGTAVSGENTSYGFAAGTQISGGYMGFPTLGTPATLVFNNPLSFFGITAVPRSDNGVRTATLSALLSDGTTAAIGTGTANTGASANAVFYGYTAPAGLSISRVVITADGFTRFDDLAFAVVPEPASLGLLSIGGLAMLRRRRRA